MRRRRGPAATRDYLKRLDPASTTVYGVGGQAVSALTAWGCLFFFGGQAVIGDDVLKYLAPIMSRP